jgi:hypothetical protein
MRTDQMPIAPPIMTAMAMGSFLADDRGHVGSASWRLLWQKESGRPLKGDEPQLNVGALLTEDEKARLDQICEEVADSNPSGAWRNVARSFWKAG